VGEWLSNVSIRYVQSCANLFLSPSCDHAISLQEKKVEWWNNAKFGIITLTDYRILWVSEV